MIFVIIWGPENVSCCFARLRSWISQYTKSKSWKFFEAGIKAMFNDSAVDLRLIPLRNNAFLSSVWRIVTASSGGIEWIRAIFPSSWWNLSILPLAWGLSEGVVSCLGISANSPPLSDRMFSGSAYAAQNLL